MKISIKSQVVLKKAIFVVVKSLSLAWPCTGALSWSFSDCPWFVRLHTSGTMVSQTSIHRQLCAPGDEHFRAVYYHMLYRMQIPESYYGFKKSCLHKNQEAHATHIHERIYYTHKQHLFATSGTTSLLQCKLIAVQYSKAFQMSACQPWS